MTPDSPQTIVLVGMMGSGKTAVGRRLAELLGLPFLDSDAEIESAAGMTIASYFEKHGEPAFREGERRVIARLLAGSACVLSTGGGAFMNPETRKLIADKAISVWLKADKETLMHRTEGRDDRPLLAGGNLREKLTSLLAVREPVYAEADITILSDQRPPEDTATRVLAALRECARIHR